MATALCRLQAECLALKQRAEGTQEELQLSRSSAEPLRRDGEAAAAALQAAREEAESLRTDLGRTNFRLGDMQETLLRLQVKPVLGSPVTERRSMSCLLFTTKCTARRAGAQGEGSQGMCALCRLPWTRRSLPG